jgi:hypothetical protein
MLMVRTQRGVCAACKYDPDCIWARNSDRPVLQCEQFELGVASPPPTTARANSPAKGLEGARSAEREEAHNYPGLCSNCDNRETCIYPRPEGGIWHCDEYR